MNFSPPAKDYILGDPWLYCKDGTWHLFYLRNPAGRPGEDWHPWESIGHAVSSNLLDWQEAEGIPLKSDNPSDWDAGVNLSGNIFEFGTGYAITYGGIKDDIQRIGILTSDDLYHWKKLPQNPVLVTSGLYEYDPAQTLTKTVEFRDASVRRLLDGTYEAIFCGRANSGPFQTRGAVGRAVSRDAITWTFVAPLVHPGCFNAPEMPNRISCGAKHYVLFSMNHMQEGALAGRRYPEILCSSFYAVSDHENEDFKFSFDQVLTPGSNYTGRIIRAGKEYLYFHHAGNPKRGMLALPKSAQFQTDGTIRLTPWSGLKQLETGQPSTGLKNFHLLERNGFTIGQLTDTRLSVEAGVATAIFDQDLADFRLQVHIDWKHTDKAGILLRNQAIALVADRQAGELSIGKAQLRNFSHYSGEQKHRYRLEGTELDHFTLEATVRSEGVDWYLNGTNIYTTMHEDAPPQGRLAFFVTSGHLDLTNLIITPLKKEPTYNST
jgi:hypothetical protein